jgi:uncharacterized membrane protein YadS
VSVVSRLFRSFLHFWLFAVGLCLCGVAAIFLAQVFSQSDHGGTWGTYVVAFSIVLFIVGAALVYASAKMYSQLDEENESRRDLDR